MQNPFFNEEEYRPRAFFRICVFLIFFVFAMVFLSIIGITWLNSVLAALVVLAIYYFSFKYMDMRNWDLSGLIINRIWWNECFAGMVIAASVMGLIFLTEWINEDLQIAGFAWQGNQSIDNYRTILTFLVMMMSVSFYEEVMTRGYLLRNMAEGFSIASVSPRQATIVAVLISSAFFGIAHAGNPSSNLIAVLNIILAGIMLAIPFVITERLSMSIGIHFAWNFFQGGIFGFPVSGIKAHDSLIHIYQGGEEWWTGGEFGPEGGVIGILGIFIILLLSVYFLKMTGNEIRISNNFKKKYTTDLKV